MCKAAPTAPAIVILVNEGAKALSEINFKPHKTTLDLSSPKDFSPSARQVFLQNA
jgi:hypothetical protein